MPLKDVSPFFNLSADLFAFIGFDGNLKKVNNAWEHTLGWKSEDIIDKPYLNVIHPEDHLDTNRQAKILHNGGVTNQFENRVLTKSGAVRIFRWKAVAMQERQLIYATATDITEEKEQQLSMIALARLSSVGDMAAGIAHEINNPLAIIIGKSAMLRRKIDKGEASNEEVEKTLKTVESTCQRIVRIINGLRSLSRNAEMDPCTPTMLQTIVEDALELCQERFRKYNVELKVEICPALSIECRAPQIGTAILDLLVNAMDAVKGTDGAWVLLKTEDANEKVRITVTDSGKGIPKEVAARLMEPFFTTKEVGKGTGLGLAISRGRIESHGGTLSLNQSCPNTQFVIELPKRQSALKQAA